MASDRPASGPGDAEKDLLILAGLSLILFLYHILTAALPAYRYFIDDFTSSPAPSILPSAMMEVVQDLQLMQKKEMTDEHYRNSL